MPVGVYCCLLLQLVLMYPCAAELGLNAEVTELVNECEQPSLVQSLLLPEDLALRHLPALGVAHRRLDFTHRSPSLSPLQEVHAATRHIEATRWQQHVRLVCCQSQISPFRILINEGSHSSADAGIADHTITGHVCLHLSPSVPCECVAFAALATS